MKSGLFGQQLTLMEALKASSFTAHAQLQSVPFFQGLSACQLPLESYVGQLRALAIVHGVLEQALASCSDARIGAVWSEDQRSLGLLQQDLHFFEPRAVADLKNAVDAALETAERIRVAAAEQPLSLLGALYVLEGSNLGAQVLRPLYARAYLLEDNEGLASLSGDSHQVHARWTQFKQRMNALSLNSDECEEVCQAAAALFAGLESVYRALYPFEEASRTFLVTSINPEAGRHPIPADSREVEAALTAGDRCWERFPYFEQRYGERGRRFARSDAAWLATLYPYEPQRISKQVRWLGRVLAGRGMPTLLLQDQLELLVQELDLAAPGRRSEFEPLSQAASELHAARARHLSDDQIQALEQSFDQAVGVEWSTRLPHTGALLACAVADEIEGAVVAVDALLGWMADTARFPAVWIAAVHATVAQARGQAELTKK